MEESAGALEGTPHSPGNAEPAPPAASKSTASTEMQPDKGGSSASPPGGGAGDLAKPSTPAAVEKDAWDPLKHKKSQATPWALKRIRRDLRTLLSDPLPGIFVHCDEQDMTVAHALISGPFETPYEGGFFYFVLRFPDDYPNTPPKVRLITTGGGRTRFNPNLYQCGKVCLSILGTWEGPSWSPAQTLSSVLLSIQSLMNAAPYHNEPGFEAERRAGDSKNYNDVIEHETLRAAVCDMLEGKVPMPPALVKVMRVTFDSLREMYTDKIKACCHKDGSPFADPYRQNMGNFQYAALKSRLQQIPPLDAVDGGGA
mmetsp:Transcript_58057/g.142414  ORF Transcript_58057/g.142414 Transcript_58057/m.142414 type:complete len:313 (-) Transcript_58057:196-1134(-)|eukprot:CAMPEP_0206228502 /NCGR_PEP_ID=MMETSP0047_2-20121206/9203_1 /ASSEMBLY_ACC=CAM_ASM_000192 /TAXON_ID=195065 /ORGANISM="Chroomonas mesostigmatica_cf, Strain CCMP1168" /LENGTH=312 /DNA_ID=CAMNT_0053651749 /DNA_START=61 /DNA_END=999 /DNA_ORIENTATION=-